MLDSQDLDDNQVIENELPDDGNIGKPPQKLTQRQNSIVGIEDNFPFKSIADFLPTTNNEEVI